MRAMWLRAVPIRRASGRLLAHELLYRERPSAEPSFQDRRVGINAAVAKEWPVAAGVLHSSGIALRDQNFLVGVGALREHFAKRPGNKRVAPEFESTVSRTFQANPIRHCDIDSVGDGM